MEAFKIEVKETLSKIVEIEAGTIEEAMLKIQELYSKQEIILDSGDFVETEFVCLED